jgi:hypothetical protein
MGPFAHYDTGPNAGQTPEDDADLRSSANPFANSSPPADLSDDTRRGFSVTGPSGGPAGPYWTPPPSVATNPYAAGSGVYAPGERSVADDVAGGLSNVYEHTLGNATGAGVGGSPADINDDEGFGRDGQGRS